MGDRGRNAADLRTLADPAAGATARTVPLHHPRVSFRQRQRVHQLHSLPASRKAVDRTDQITRAPHGRQRSGGIEERSDPSQTHGLQPYRRTACGGGRSISPRAPRFLRQLPRPCAIAEIVEEPNGKRRRVYRKWATPFEIFSQLPQCESYLRPGLSMAELESFAQKQSDTEAAMAMQLAKKRLLSGIAKRSA